MTRRQPFLPLLILALAMLANVVPAQYTAAIQFANETNGIAGYSEPTTVKSYTLLESPVDENWAGVAWSSTNAVPFTLSQLYADTNVVWGSRVRLTEVMTLNDGTTSPLMPTAIFDPTLVPADGVFLFVPTNNAPVVIAPATNLPAVTVIGTNSMHVWVRYRTSLTQGDWMPYTNFETAWPFSVRCPETENMILFSAGVSAGADQTVINWTTNK